MKFKKSTLAAALVAPCALGLAGQAQAGAYATSFNHIKNGLVLALVDKHDGAGFIVDAAVLSFATPSSTSSASATLNGTGVSNNASGANPDALAANGNGANPLRANENVHGIGGAGPTGVSYVMFGDDNGNYATPYSSADARVITEQALINNQLVGFEAHAIAESNIPGNGFADAGARNASSTALTATINAGANCAIYTCLVSIQFDANPYNHAFLGTDSVNPPSVARSILDTSATITKLNDLLPTFAWSPNGVVGTPATPNGVFGGVEGADAENLNLTTEALFPGQDSMFSAANTFGFYQASTLGLGTGQYTMNLQMGVKTDVRNQVPEPGIVSLLGIGLAGIGWMSRARNRNS